MRKESKSWKWNRVDLSARNHTKFLSTLSCQQQIPRYSFQNIARYQENVLFESNFENFLVLETYEVKFHTKLYFYSMQTFQEML